MPERTSEKPYWLLSSEEDCTFCGHGYSWAVEVRCVECDGPMCPICAVTVHRHEPSCPDCLSGDEGKD